MLVVGKVTPQCTVLFLHNVLRSLGVFFFFGKFPSKVLLWFAKICVPNWWVKSNVTFNIHLSFFFDVSDGHMDTANLSPRKWPAQQERRSWLCFSPLPLDWTGGKYLGHWIKWFFSGLLMFFALLDVYDVLLYIIISAIDHSWRIWNAFPQVYQHDMFVPIWQAD